MPLYQINGYDVEFPHEAYPCQVSSLGVPPFAWGFLLVWGVEDVLRMRVMQQLHKVHICH